MKSIAKSGVAVDWFGTDGLFKPLISCQLFPQAPPPRPTPASQVHANDTRDLKRQGEREKASQLAERNHLDSKRFAFSGRCELVPQRALPTGWFDRKAPRTHGARVKTGRICGSCSGTALAPSPGS